MRRSDLDFVELVATTAAVELQLGVGIVAPVVLAHPGDEGEVLVVLHAQCAREKEVDKAVVLKGKAEVVEVAQPKGVGLHC